MTFVYTYEFLTAAIVYFILCVCACVYAIAVLNFVVCVHRCIYNNSVYLVQCIHICVCAITSVYVYVCGLWLTLLYFIQLI